MCVMLWYVYVLQVMVRFLDYGNVEEVHPHFVSSIPEEFLGLPFQVSLCRHVSVSHSSSRVSLSWLSTCLLLVSDVLFCQLCRHGVETRGWRECEIGSA